VTAPVRVLVADDHALLRHGVRALLEAAGGFEVAGEVADGHQVVPLTLRLRPDILLLDLDLPGPAAPATIRRLGSAAARAQRATAATAVTAAASTSAPTAPSALAPPGALTAATALAGVTAPADRGPGQGEWATRVLPLGTRADLPLLRDCLEAGAAGFVLKEAPGSELVGALREVGRGGKYISPAVLKHGAASQGGWTSRTGRSRRGAALTSRERQILECVVAGLANREIAGRLCLSVRTVEAHKARIVAKLDLRGARDLVRAALQSPGVRPLRGEAR
jgi:DNA-binding NarL/FixJ family response regulator